MTINLQLSKTITLLLFSIMYSFSVKAQSEPFNCDYNAYLFQYNDVYALDLASGSSYLVAENVTTGNINAVGYNPTDGFIWGSLSTPSKSIVKIGKNFQAEVFYIPELPTSNRYVGDVSEAGVYYLKSGGSVYHKVDVNPESPNYGTHISTGTLTQNLNIHDWAFNAVDGMLYTVEKSSNKLYRIDPETSEVLDLGVVPVLSGLKYTFGAVYFDVEGRFYVSANQTGTVYVIQDVQNLENGSTIDSNLFAFGPSSSLNDGARCPTAPVPQEDCLNGVDDDGDGLSDCDDPACSGIAACPVIQPQVSSGNKGGLESNDRLSQQINKRNYLRTKSNYKFNKKEARKIIKKESYKKKVSRSSNFELMDLMPLDVLSNTDAIESSANDLIQITNAVELFSVDYVRNDETIAVVLATKTINGVYEHTKYICDRLLGAELLSVSTIEIREQQFIKSIIKNSDGTKEFVLSFSGKVTNNDENFEIESHWNIDKYQPNATFYNFQIWTNQIDDLLTLGEETLELFNVQREITSYNLSKPPPVFVKKGKYVNGTLELELVNANSSETVTVDAGFKRTETSNTEYFNNSITLAEGYITPLVIETGNIFDIGFRIENNTNETPDDLFMSDGPWGTDDSALGTTLNEFTITQNENLYNGSGYRVERNILLKATTNEYVAAYRAFTPTFKPVDLTAFSNLELDASGTGVLEITIIKQSIGSWENQFRTTITLNETQNHYSIPYEHFTSIEGGNLNLNDAVNIVFTMSSDGVEFLEKEMNLSNIDFTERVLGVDDEVIAVNEITVFPNPMSSNTVASFYSEVNTTTDLEIYNIIGALVKKIKVNSEIGNNKVDIKREGLKSGLYFIKLKNDYRNYKTIKLLVN